MKFESYYHKYVINIWIMRLRLMKSWDVIDNSDSWFIFCFWNSLTWQAQHLRSWLRITTQQRRFEILRNLIKPKLHSMTLLQPNENTIPPHKTRVRNETMHESCWQSGCSLFKSLISQKVKTLYKKLQNKLILGILFQL